MKRLFGLTAIVAIVLCVSITPSRAGDFNYASYTQTTIQDILWEEQQPTLDQTETQKDPGCIHLEYRVSKYRVTCRYSNLQRPISEIKKNMIKLWMETLRIDPKLASLYSQEIRVTDGTRVHWIPIQKQLIPYIDQELGKNDPISLFILFIGQVESEYVFIATEFEKPVSPARNSSQAAACTSAKP